MGVNREILSQTIIEVARHEDLILRRVEKGIFLVPELASIDAVGRELAIKGESVWARRRTVSYLTGPLVLFRESAN
jgi:hypothetical protein